MGADISEFTSSTRDMMRQVGVLDVAFSKLRGGLGALGGLLGIGSLASFAKDTIESAGQLQDASDRLGVSAGLLEQVTHEAKKSGGSLGSVVTAFQALAKSMAEVNDENPEIIQAFKQLGQDGKKIKDLNLGQAFKQMMDSLEGAKLNDPNNISAFLKIFGKGSGELIPLFKGGAGIDKQIESGTNVATRQLDAVGDKISDVARKGKNLGRDILAGLTEIFGFGDLSQNESDMPGAKALSRAELDHSEKRDKEIKDKAEKERKEKQKKLEELSASLDEKRYKIALQGLTVEEQIAENRKKAKGLSEQAAKELVGGDQVKALELLNRAADLNLDVEQLRNKKMPDSTRTTISEPGANSLQRIGALNRDSQTVLTLQKESNTTLKKIEANTKQNTGKLGVAF